MDKIAKILSNWGITHSSVLQKYGSGERVVYKIKTKIGTVILKCQPSDSTEEFINGNIRAHEFLGNQHKMAPKLYYMPDGTAVFRDDGRYYYVMEYIEGRQAKETVEDERLLGEASARMHLLSGYNLQSTYNINDILERSRGWFSEYLWKNEYDEIIASLPDFGKHRQCFIHTDIGPHNAIIRNNSAVFIDLDGAGLGSQYIDLGWPFIMQFVDYNKQTHEMNYRFDLAKAFLDGYTSIYKLTRLEYDLLWSGAIFMHISYMKTYGKDAEQPLWNILKFGNNQKDELLSIINGTI